MSDLISRSALLETIAKYKFGAISNEIEREYTKCVIIGFISEQPTAYDLDKVVKQLEEYKKSKENLYVGKVVGAIIDCAIEIVKAGVRFDEA